MSTLYLVKRGEKVTAPLTTAQLKQCAKNGQIRANDLIAEAGTEKWHPAERVKGLFAPVATGGEIIPAPRTVVVPQPVAPPPVEPPQRNIGEQLIWEGSPSQIVNTGAYIAYGLFFLSLLPLAILILPIALLPVPVFLICRRWLSTSHTNYELTTQRLNIATGVFARQEHSLELYRVKDTSFRQTFFERMLNRGTVTIVSSDNSHPQVDIAAIPADQAANIREAIRECRDVEREKKGVREVEHI